MADKSKVTARKVVVITGASSGIGFETAKLFAKNGWQVVATMRELSHGKALLKSGAVELMRLDVLETDSIRQAFALALKKHGRIDVLVNNAGYGLIGPIEGATKEQIQAQTDTNLVGLMDATRQVLPYMRKSGSGTIVNIASIAGLAGFPLHSAYNATKFGVEGFSESLQYDVRQFGIRVKLVEPGGVETDFYNRSMVKLTHPAYAKYSAALGRLLSGGSGARSPPARIAEVIYRAANDSSYRLRYPAGNDAVMLSFMRKVLPYGVFSWLLRRVVGG
jgi:NAD(P)-dependent dehydrogenase (short-subunit alcohol dehydrogenase family)